MVYCTFLSDSVSVEGQPYPRRQESASWHHSFSHSSYQLSLAFSPNIPFSLKSKTNFVVVVHVFSQCRSERLLNNAVVLEVLKEKNCRWFRWGSFFPSLLLQCLLSVQTAGAPVSSPFFPLKNVDDSLLLGISTNAADFSRAHGTSSLPLSIDLTFTWSSKTAIETIGLGSS